MKPFSILLFTALFAYPVLGADSMPPLSDIIKRVIARDDANQKALQSMQYQENLKTERLDAQGKPGQRQELQMIVRPGATPDTKVLSEKGDNLPANPDEAALQAQGKAAQNKNVNFSLKDMANRFNITFIGTDAILGQPVYVVAFEPRPNQPYRDQTEKVLDQLHGKMWISTRDYSVLKTDATLAQPVNVAWIFAQVSALEFRYGLSNTSGGMGPCQILTSVKIDAPFFHITQRTTIDMDHFQAR